MRPTNIFLVRHGESEANADKTVYGRIPDWQIDITALGRAQARSAADRLNALITPPDRPFIGVYMSPYRRAVQTWVEIYGQLTWRAAFVKDDARLRELERGNPLDRDATPVEYHLTERERHKQGSLFYRVKDGESGSQCYDRVASFRETLERESLRPDFPSNVVIVGHSFTQRVVEMVLCDLTVDQFHALPDPKNAEIVHLSLAGDRYARVSGA